MFRRNSPLLVLLEHIVGTEPFDCISDGSLRASEVDAEVPAGLGICVIVVDAQEFHIGEGGIGLYTYFI